MSKEPKYVLLKNQTKETKVAIFGEYRIVFGPSGGEDSEQAVEAELAESVLRQLGPAVSKIDMGEVGGEYVSDEVPQMVWLANITGNPDAPDMVVAGHYLDRETQQRKQALAANLAKEPKDIRELCKGAQTVIHTISGPWGKTGPGKVLELPAYNRAEFPIDEARWLLRRSGTGPIKSVMKCRPYVRGEFEPNKSWGLNDLRAWLAMVDPTTEKDNKLGPREEEILASIKTQMVAEKGKALSKTEEATAARRAAQELFKAKTLALKRCYFRLVDPKYPHPTEDEFKRFKAAFYGDSREQPTHDGGKHAEEFDTTINSILDS